MYGFEKVKSKSTYFSFFSFKSHKPMYGLDTHVCATRGVILKSKWEIERLVKVILFLFLLAPLAPQEIFC